MDYIKGDVRSVRGHDDAANMLRSNARRDFYGANSVLRSLISTPARFQSGMNPVELGIVNAICTRDTYSRYDPIIDAGEIERKSLCNMAPDLVDKFSVAGTISVLVAVIEYGRFCKTDADRTYISAVLDMIPNVCLLWPKVPKVSSEPMKVYDNVWNGIRSKIKLPLDSLLTLAASTDSDILFKRIVTMAGSRDICTADWLLSVMIHSGSVECLKWFLEANPWCVDFKSLDLSYYFATIGYQAAENRVDSMAHRTYYIPPNSEERIYNPLSGEIICMQMLADKVLEPGWEHRWPIGMRADEAAIMMLEVDPYYGIPSAVACLRHNAFGTNQIRFILNDMSRRSVHDAGELLHVLNAANKEMLCKVLSDDLYEAIVIFVGKFAPWKNVQVGSSKFQMYGGFGLLKALIETRSIFGDVSHLENKTAEQLFEEVLIQRTIDVSQEINTGEFAYALWRFLDADGDVLESVESLLCEKLTVKEREEVLLYVQSFVTHWYEHGLRVSRLHAVYARDVLSALASKAHTAPEQVTGVNLGALYFD